MSFHQLISQSQSLIPFEAPELEFLLNQSRANNQRLAITGLLLNTPDGRFLHVLEGPREAVRALYYQRIAHDPRHYNCQVIGEGPSAVRSFPHSPLAYRAAQALDLRRLLAPVAVAGAALLVPRPRTRTELLELLAEFVLGTEPAMVS